jgi:uncharacterized membrane-anchored protein YitT (DUF2179 family)
MLVKRHGKRKARLQAWLRPLLQELKKCRLRNFAGLTVAGLVNAFGVTVFLAPVKLYDSGISGTSMLLAQVTPPQWSLSVFLLLLNLPLFLYGLRRQGVTFTLYAVYTVAVYALGAWLITDVLPIDVRMASPLAGSDLLLCALFGGMISGCGSGLAIRFGGAMDGVEVMAVIFAKGFGITVGTFVMLYNVLLYIVCGVALQSWILPLYSIVTYMAALRTVDFIVEGLDRSKAVLIVTAKAQVVCDALSRTFAHGMTVLDATSFYSGEKKSAVYIVLNRFQISRMRNLVHEIDPAAYMTITEVADVFKLNQDM